MSKTSKFEIMFCMGIMTHRKPQDSARILKHTKVLDGSPWMMTILYSDHNNMSCFETIYAASRLYTPLRGKFNCKLS